MESDIGLAVTDPPGDTISLHDGVDGDERDVDDEEEKPLDTAVLELRGREPEREAQTVGPKGDGEDEGHQEDERFGAREDGEQVDPGHEGEERAQRPRGQVGAKEDALPQRKGLGHDAEPEPREPPRALLGEVKARERRLLVSVLGDAARHAPVPPDVALEAVAAHHKGTVHPNQRKTEHPVLECELGIVICNSDHHSLADARELGGAADDQRVLLAAMLEDVSHSACVEPCLLVEVYEPVLVLGAASIDSIVERPRFELAATRRRVIIRNDDLRDLTLGRQTHGLVCDHLELPPIGRERTGAQDHEGCLAVAEDEVRVVSARHDSEVDLEWDLLIYGLSAVRTADPLRLIYQLLLDGRCSRLEYCRVEQETTQTHEEGGGRSQEDPREGFEEIWEPGSAGEVTDGNPGVVELCDAKSDDDDDEASVVQDELLCVGAHPIGD
eukprot:3936952-Rhodomonas_salina.4